MTLKCLDPLLLTDGVDLDKDVLTLSADGINLGTDGVDLALGTDLLT